MEEALCSIDHFSQVKALASAFTTTNPALARRMPQSYTCVTGGSHGRVQSR